MGISWKLRKLLSNGNSAIAPDDWVMNLDINRYKRPNTEASIKRHHLLDERYSLEFFLQPNWSWVALESLYQLDQIDRMLEHLPAISCHPKRNSHTEGLMPVEPKDLLHHLGDPSATPLLQNASPQDDDAIFHWIDVGCKNLGMLPALLAAATALSDSPIRFTGIELDPYRRYLDGKTRGDYARGMVAQFPNVDYIEDNMMNVASQFSGQANVVSCFLPFMQASEHCAWGLGKQQFRPERFFASLVEMLAPRGVLLISNLSKQEATITRTLLTPYLTPPDIGAGLVSAYQPASPSGGYEAHPYDTETLDGSPQLLLHCDALELTPHFMQMQEPTRYLWTLQKKYS